MHPHPAKKNCTKLTCISPGNTRSYSQADTKAKTEQTTKKPTGLGWLFLLQINDLPEFDVERAMGIEHVGLGSLSLSMSPLTN